MTTLEQFVASVRAGQISRGGGGPAAGGLSDGLAVLESNADAITAEAFNQEIVDPESSWDDVRRKVMGLLEEPNG